MAEHTPVRMSDTDERYLTWLYTVGKSRQNWHTIFLKGSPKRALNITSGLERCVMQDRVA